MKAGWLDRHRTNTHDIEYMHSNDLWRAFRVCKTCFIRTMSSRVVLLLLAMSHSRIVLYPHNMFLCNHIDGLV